MKKNVTLAVFFLLILGFTFALKGQQQATLNGWVSDQQCAAKGGVKASHKECAKKCIEMGKKLVLVSDLDGKVYAVQNPERLKGQEGTHVRVVGISNENDGTLVAGSWSPFAASPAHGEGQQPLSQSTTNASGAVQGPVGGGPSSQSPPTTAQPAEQGPLADFVDAQIVRDIRARLGNCGGKVNVTDLKVTDKKVNGDQGQALVDVTANWVAPYNVWATPMECLGFSQSGGKNQKARVRAVYNKWESGWRLEHASINEFWLF